MQFYLTNFLYFWIMLKKILKKFGLDKISDFRARVIWEFLFIYSQLGSFLTEPQSEISFPRCDTFISRTSTKIKNTKKLFGRLTYFRLKYCSRRYSAFWSYLKDKTNKIKVRWSEQTGIHRPIKCQMATAGIIHWLVVTTSVGKWSN